MDKLTPSQEDYLETIYVLVKKNNCAKVTDIARVLEVKKASVTGALSSLLEKNLINYAPYSPITLTPKGELAAKQILIKHQVMTSFFQNILQLDEEEAVENACKMEHIMSEKLFDRIHAFSHFIDNYSQSNQDFKNNLINLYK